MDIDKEELAAKASEVTGQAKELLSKVDTKKAMGATNKFMAGVFKFVKIISALFMLLCILTMVGSLLYYAFARAGSFQAPVFDPSMEEESEYDSSSSKSDGAQKAEYRKVRDKYGKKVDAIVDLFDMKATASEDVLKLLCKMDKEYRGEFVSGALSFGKAHKKYLDKKGRGGEFDVTSFTTYYHLFNDAVDEAGENQMAAQVSRQVALSVCGGAFLGLVLFLFLPLLIQIEENTRK